MSKHVRTVAHDPKFVILSDGRWEHAVTATAAGLIVFDEERQAQIRAVAEGKATDQHAKPGERAAARVDLARLDREDYAHAIRSLPEARNRRAAAGRVIAAHNAQSMPPERAEMFLRNLPIEDADAPTSTPRHVEPPSVPLRRKAELALAAASAKARAGDYAAERRAKAIGDALKFNADRGIDLARALEVCGVLPQSL